LKCLLCQSPEVSEFFLTEYHHFYNCNSCGTVYRNPATFLSPAEEKARYEQHINDVDDIRYQNFVRPIVSAVKAMYPSSAVGLDYGAGTGPVITKLLIDSHYLVKMYDPFFHPYTAVLERSYDFIVCCEVIEHFHKPVSEFKKLYNLLNPGGRLFCMTDLLNDGDFAKWYYKDDPTHVLFYNRENLEWIKNKTGFSDLDIDGRLITLKK